MNRLRITSAFVAPVLLGALPGAIAATPAEAVTQDAIRQMAAEVFRPVVERYDIPGIAIGITLNGEETYFVEGEAVRATRAPVTTETIFELGSISKLFTVALAELAEGRGLLKLKDSVASHEPALKGTAFETITLLNLATHTTGGLPLQVPDGVTDDGASLNAYLRSFEPKGDPNASRSYSNVSIGLLGKLSAASFGKPYADAVRDELTQGLGLSSTFVDVPAQAADRYAFGYAKDGDRPVRVNPGVLAAEAYGVKSTVTDMTRFLEAHLGTADVPQDKASALADTRKGYFETDHFVQDLVWEQYPWPVEADRLKAGNSSKMALEMQPVRRLDPPRPPASQGVFLNKTGSTNGFGAYVALVPSEKLGIVVLANRNYPNDARAEAARQLIQAIEAADAR